jgi:pyruvate/2-oxoglutarate dehydrogenase complex dihydrolipoamide acyltransferase (E2) component
VIELLAQPGDSIGKDQGLLTLESDKATMEVPSPAAGVLKEWKVKVGDSVAEGQLLAILEAEDGAKPLSRAAPAAPAEAKPATASQRPARARPYPRPPRRLRSPRRPLRPAMARPPTSNASWSCSVPGPAATRPPSAPPTWAWTWCWWSAIPS